MIKLCVGISSVEELIAYRQMRREQGFGRPDGFNVHRTRMMPKRRDDIVGKGSLYWVIGGAVRCRQLIAGLDAVTGEDGLSYCDIVMHPDIMRTAPMPKRPFQGWRYLNAADAPSDVGVQDATVDSQMMDELARMGLL